MGSVCGPDAGLAGRLSNGAGTLLRSSSPCAVLRRSTSGYSVLLLQAQGAVLSGQHHAGDSGFRHFRCRLSPGPSCCKRSSTRATIYTRVIARYFWVWTSTNCRPPSRFRFEAHRLATSPLLITPGIGIELWNGPVSQGPGSADLPPRTYDAWLDFGYNPQFSPYFTQNWVCGPVFFLTSHTSTMTVGRLGRATACSLHAHDSKQVGHRVPGSQQDQAITRWRCDLHAECRQSLRHFVSQSETITPADHGRHDELLGLRGGRVWGWSLGNHAETMAATTTSITTTFAFSAASRAFPKHVADCQASSRSAIRSSDG